MLDRGWEAASTAPDACDGPAATAALRWLPARVPGTAAGALLEAGSWHPGEPSELDAEDWWFRCRFDAAAPAQGEEVVLRLDGIATVAEVYLDGERILDGDSMFVAHAVDVGSRLPGAGELTICCRSLAPRLRERRRPRARWRTRLLYDGNLRFLRTSALGRAPGFSPGPAPVGPWRPVWLERRRRIAVEELRLRPRLDGAEGVLGVGGRVRSIDGAAITAADVELTGPSGTHRAALRLDDERGAVSLGGALRVPDVARWWPHTHGDPALHDVGLRIATESGDAVAVELGRVGFRSLSAGAGAGHDVEVDGLDVHVNGRRVFARGVVWTPVDDVGLAPDDGPLRATIERIRDAGMNMVRIPGTGVYESAAFHDLCDELGLLVWQDFLFANLDYPIADPTFREAVEREVADVLAQVGGRPSLAVLCGNSEVEQQVAMLGLDPALGRGELFGELLPARARAAGVDVPYVPSAPCGGDLPFRPGRGIANYYGVGAYRRPLQDARRAGVRFAAECLAFSNVPDDAAIEAMATDAGGAPPVHHPRWKAGVPRDVGSGWDFEDVRDHYLQLLFEVDPLRLRSVDHERYLELSRAVTGEVMAEVLGEWRRAASPCAGGLVLWLRDLVPGAGWGVLDHRGEPKAAYHHLRRALAPVAVWMTDEGLAGIAVHVANDRPDPLRARLRVALYGDAEHRVGEASEAIELGAHATASLDVEAVLGHFADVSWAYRFGAPAQDVVVASLEGDDGLISQSFRFPAGRPLGAVADLGLEALASPAEGGAALTVRSRRLAYGVRVVAPGFDAGDDAFCVEPGGQRTVMLRARSPEAAIAGAALTALNLRGRVVVT